MIRKNKLLAPFAFLCLLFVLHGCTSKTSNRLLTIKDMIAMSNMSHDRAIKFIVQDKKGILIANRTVYKQQITEYDWSKGDSVASISKSQWKDCNQLFHSVHCDFKPVSYHKQIYAQLKNEGFVLKGRTEVGGKSYRLYQRGYYTVSVDLFEKDSLPLSVELHKLK